MARIGGAAIKAIATAQTESYSPAFTPVDSWRGCSPGDLHVCGGVRFTGVNAGLYIANSPPEASHSIMARVIALLEQHRPDIEALCRRHRVKRLDVFGSAARGDFDPATSDLDFLVEFQPLGWQGYSHRYFGLLHGLEDLFTRDIDLVDVTAVRNPLFLEVATKTREGIFDAA